jgi:hypothetical protein
VVPRLNGCQQHNYSTLVNFVHFHFSIFLQTKVL